jgi:hypothetical protein
MMVKFKTAVRTKPPEVAVSVIFDEPATAVPATVNVPRMKPEFDELNAAETPAGSPELASVTVPVNPFTAVMTIDVEPLVPCTTLKLSGFTVTAKSGGRATVSAITVVAERAPEVPVMVTDAVPIEAEALAVRVNLAELNAAVTPMGNPVATRAGVPVNPLIGDTAMVLVADVPRTTVKLAGEAVSENAAAPLTVKLSVIEVDAVPLVPVTVTVVVPTTAAGVALTVTMLVVAVVAGLNEAVTPTGSPDAASTTLPVKPVFGVTVMVAVALAPCTTLNVETEDESENVACGRTVKAIPTDAVRAPDLPVIVMLEEPATAVELATKLRVLAPPTAGPKDAVTPTGRPVTARLTVPVNPLVGATVIVAEAVPACTTLTPQLRS